MPLANRLWVHEIDEVSGVDRDANGFAKVLITKRDPGEEATMGLYDADGNEVSEDQLVPGNFYYDGPGEDAREFRCLDEAAISELSEDEYNELDIPDDPSSLFDGEYADELEPVGKSAAEPIITGAKSAVRRAGSAVEGGFSRIGHGVSESMSGYGGGSMPNGDGRTAFRAGRGLHRNQRVIGIGAGGAAAGYAGGRVRKSMGDQVLETLSKALGDSERDQVISKAINQLQRQATAAEQRAIRAERVAKSLEDQAILNKYVELADEYDLPVDSAEFGEILAGIGEAGFSKRQLEVLDAVFSAAGMNSSPLFNEIGAGGAHAPSSVLDQVDAAVAENVSKADVSPEQLAAAIFEANPGLYAEYEAEQRAGLHR